MLVAENEPIVTPLPFLMSKFSSQQGKSVDAVMKRKVHVINGKQVEIKVAVPRSDSAGSYASTGSTNSQQPLQHGGERSSDDQGRMSRQCEDKKEDDDPVKVKKPLPTTSNFSYATALKGSQTASKVSEAETNEAESNIDQYI